MIYWNLIKKYIPLAAMVVLIVAGYINSVRIDKLKTQLAQAREDTEKAVTANKQNVKTIDELLDDRLKSARLCQRDKERKDELLDVCRKTHELIGGNNVSNILVDPTGGNAILDTLNGLLQEKSSNGGEVREAADTEAGPGALVGPGQLVYCVSEIGARNLILNFEFLRAWGRGMHDTLSTYATETE